MAEMLSIGRNVRVWGVLIQGLYFVGSMVGKRQPHWFCWIVRCYGGRQHHQMTQSKGGIS